MIDKRAALCNIALLHQRNIQWRARFRGVVICGSRFASRAMPDALGFWGLT